MNKPWKETTIYDIAEKLNLSASTVSRALNNHPIIKEKTRKLVRATAEKMNFEFGAQPRIPASSSQRTIGVVVPFLYRDQMAEMVSGIIETANLADYEVIVSQSFGLIAKEADILKSMFKKKVDGLLICVAFEKQEMEHFAKFCQHKIPICSFYKVWNNSYCGQVRINDFRAAYELTAHLINEGCSNIGYVTHHSGDSIYIDRFNGFKAALKDHQLSYDTGLVFKTDLSPDAGKGVAMQIALSGRAPDGLLIDDDMCAAACMNTLKLNGCKVPAEISMATFGSHAAAITDPPLTSVDFQRYQLGQIAANQLINQLKYKDLHSVEPFKAEIGHELNVRHSTLKSQAYHTV